VVVVCLALAGVTHAQEEAAPPSEEGAAPPPAEPPPAQAAVEYPPEALELLPREVLDQLPPLITRFLRGEHYARLKEACPQTDLPALGACLEAPPASELLIQLVEQGIIASMLERMDVELPSRLGDEDYRMIADRCEEPGEVWSKCVFEKGFEDESCAESEEALARCVVENDEVTELYLGIAEEKEQLMGGELYMALRGLAAVLPIEAIRQVREACPQPTFDEAASCLEQHPAISQILAVYLQLAQGVVAEAAAEIQAAGNTIDTEAYTMQVFRLLLGLPSHTIVTLANECERDHPELANITDTAMADQALACIAAGGQTDPVANPAYISEERLREWLGIAREKVVGIIKAKESSAQDKNANRILIVLLAAAGLGFVIVLLMPVFLGRKYPGQSALLWKSSAVAAATLVVTVILLGASLLTIRTVQGKVASDSTSPKMRVAEGAFAVLSQARYVETFSAISKERLDLIKKPLRTIVKDEGVSEEEYAVFAAYLVTHWATLLEEPELARVARNADKLKSHAASLKRVMAFYKRVDWIMGFVPIVLSILAVLLYVIPLKQTLVDIATAPARAARGEGGSGDTVKRAMATVWAEVKSAVPFIGLLLVLMPVTGIFLALAVEPLVELLIQYALMTFVYLLTADASTAVLYLSLGAVIVLLVLCLAVYILSLSFALGTSRKLFRAVFHLGYRFADFKRFWIRGAASLVLLLAMPFGFVVLVRWLALGPLAPGDQLGTGDMLTLPLLALVGFPALFWAARGVKALGFLKNYPVPKAAAATATLGRAA
jgi:hypothetical protein